MTEADMRSALAAIATLHAEARPGWCAECSNVWPCPTRQFADGAVAAVRL